MNKHSATSKIRIIVTGGGTGGHLFPGIAVATKLRKNIGNCEIMFIGTDRHIDRNSLANVDFKVRSLQCSGLKGLGTGQRLKTALQLPFAIFEAIKFINEFKPHLVIGVGGYVTGPVLLAAKLKSIPTCIHEQNSVPGLANRISSKIVDKVFISLPIDNGFPQHKTILTGNPVREEILAVAQKKRSLQESEPLTIIILGGSQGAHRLNELVLEAAKELTITSPKPLRFIHQTGSKDKQWVRQAYLDLGIDAICDDFFGDMASIYHQADLAICRAGATTLAELSATGTPSILVPYPFAADNHQEINGSYYVQGQGAYLYKENELTGKLLTDQIVSLLNNSEKLRNMADKMRSLAKLDATDEIVNHCLRLLDIPDTTQSYNQIEHV